MSETSSPGNPFDDVLSYFAQASSLAEYGNNFETMKEAYVSARPLTGAGIAHVSELLKQVIFEQGFFNLLIAAKLKYIFRGASDCFQSDNVIGLAYFSRAALEHVATYAYVIKTSESTVDKLSGQNNTQKALESLKAASASFHVSFYGTGDRNAQAKGTQKPIHIHDAVKTLDGYFGEVGRQCDQDPLGTPQHSFLFHEPLTVEEVKARFGISYDPFPGVHVVRSDYDFLCDFVHPNYSSNFLVSTGTIAEGLIDTPNQHVRNLSILFVKKCLRYWLYYKQLQILDFNAHLKFGAWLQRSYKHGAKASRIFAKKASKVEGDGDSVYSAFSFPRARDKVEEFEIFGDLLRKLKVDKYSQSIADVTQEFIVDRIEADNGRVFFVKWRKSELP